MSRFRKATIPHHHDSLEAMEARHASQSSLSLCLSISPNSSRPLVFPSVLSFSSACGGIVVERPDVKASP